MSMAHENPLIFFDISSIINNDPELDCSLQSVVFSMVEIVLYLCLCIFGAVVLIRMSLPSSSSPSDSSKKKTFRRRPVGALLHQSQRGIDGPLSVPNGDVGGTWFMVLSLCLFGMMRFIQVIYLHQHQCQYRYIYLYYDDLYVTNIFNIL